MGTTKREWELMRYLLLIFLIVACVPTKQAGRCMATIRNATWEMEIAKTDEQRERGLMFRAFMPEENGMLFVFKKPTEITMWMKNTEIPLDMVFINESLHISGFYKNAKPYSENVIRTDGKTRYLLELNAGQINAAEIKEGDSVIFSGCAL